MICMAVCPVAVSSRTAGPAGSCRVGDCDMQLGVLGPLLVSRDGRVWSPGGPKERRLLAILLLHVGEVVSTDALAEALWDGAPPPSAVKTVQVYVTRLRAALAPGGP